MTRAFPFLLPVVSFWNRGASCIFSNNVIHLRVIVLAQRAPFNEKQVEKKEGHLTRYYSRSLVSVSVNSGLILFVVFHSCVPAAKPRFLDDPPIYSVSARIIIVSFEGTAGYRGVCPLLPRRNYRDSVPRCSGVLTGTVILEIYLVAEYN